ncbi:MAG TPA: gluconokinase [Longimicrobiales bacterium]|nr:gluconokinase [Longimicrobiales bacterium]
MLILIMGVSGIGKTTVGEMLAAQLGWTYVEADRFHPPGNVAKLHAGIALTDEDRAPWLAALSAELRARDAAGENVVVACSALKAKYRDALLAGIGEAVVVFLDAPSAVVAQRLAARSGHFMSPALLRSQIETLEPPAGAVRLDATLPPERLVAEIRERLPA